MRTRAAGRLRPDNSFVACKRARPCGTLVEYAHTVSEITDFRLRSFDDVDGRGHERTYCDLHRSGIRGRGPARQRHHQERRGRRLVCAHDIDPRRGRQPRSVFPSAGDRQDEPLGTRVVDEPRRRRPQARVRTSGLRRQRGASRTPGEPVNGCSPRRREAKRGKPCRKRNSSIFRNFRTGNSCG